MPRPRRPSPAEVRRRAAAVVAAAERVAAGRPADPWAKAAVGFSRELAGLAAAEPVPDPAAVADLDRRYSVAWRQHDAAPSFHFLQVSAAVADLHRCRWFDYDLRGSAGRCPECGRPIVADDAAAAGPFLSSRRFGVGSTLSLCGAVGLMDGWALLRPAPAGGPHAGWVAGVAVMAAGGVGMVTGRVVLRPP